MPQRWSLMWVTWPVLVLAAMTLLSATLALAQQPAAGESYASARAFLARHTALRELTNEQGARLAICPEWQGRVMTSSCDGLDGLSFGFIHREFIETNRADPHFNNYGGEDRFWLSPEGGQFSLWFKPGDLQNLDHWFTPPALNEGAWTVISVPADPLVRMTRHMELQNASATRLDLLVTRNIRLLERPDLGKLFGAAAAGVLVRPGVKLVGYETSHTVTNQGPPLTKVGGLVSIWMLGMFNSGPQTVVVVPYRPGSEKDLGPVVKSDYFGPVPPQRLKILPQAVLFRGDAHWRSKIGISQRRARNLLGSIDYQRSVLTLVSFTMPDDPTRRDYMNNMWQVPQPQPYTGDVVNSYNDGPPAPGQKGLGPFYEIESLSPAAVLGTGQSLEHAHRTLHIQANRAVLAELAQIVLGVSLGEVQRAMRLGE